MTEPVALVTGSALRIGACIADTLHAAGFRVLLHYRRSAAEAAALAATLNARRPDSARCLAADLDDPAAIGPLAEAALAAWGGLDLLVNNASTFSPTPFGQVTAADWDQAMASNLRAPFFLSQALAPGLRARGGAIINIVDIHAERPLKDYPVYCAAKAGLAMLTQSLALELAPQVRVNGIAPGAILWPPGQHPDAAEQQRRLAAVPLQRQGRPTDIADTVLFLARAAFITGQVLAVDGGRSINR